MPSGERSSSGASSRIVICDDDDEMRSLLTAVLKSHGFDVTETADAKGVLALVENGEAGVVVTDIGLRAEGMNGIELCKHLRTHHPNVVVIVLSGRHDGDLSAKECGAHVFLQKPVEMDELVETLRGFIES